jgi:nitrous oxidase accessory protein NosD
MAALLVLLAGGANALANTVWSVSKASSNATCSLPSATTCNTIGSAVTAAQPGDVIVVGPGHYYETVFIGKANLYLLGAQAGRDARVDRHESAKESIVDASGTPTGAGGGAAFLVGQFGIVIDGFTVQGGSGGISTPFASGIYVNPGGLVSQILNNIIQDNAMGLYLSNSHFVLVKHNLFKTNNTGASGSNTGPLPGARGLAILSNSSQDGTDITENEFIGNKAAAMVLAGARNVEVTKNTSNQDGSFVAFGNCYSVLFSHNQGKDFGARGLLPLIDSTTADAAVEVIINNQALQINDNDLEEGRVPDYNGIDFFNKGVSYACFMCQVSNNRIKRFAGNGIVADATSCASTLQWSGVSGNIVEDNGNVGILIGATPCASPPSPYNQFNEFISLVDNEAQGNHVNDCEDDTTGSGSTLIGTLGTANTWFNNIGTSSSPKALCTPGRGHDHDWR